MTAQRTAPASAAALTRRRKPPGTRDANVWSSCAWCCAPRDSSRGNIVLTERISSESPWRVTALQGCWGDVQPRVVAGGVACVWGHAWGPRLDSREPWACLLLGGIEVAVVGWPGVAGISGASSRRYQHPPFNGQKPTRHAVEDVAGSSSRWVCLAVVSWPPHNSVGNTLASAWSLRPCRAGARARTWRVTDLY